MASLTELRYVVAVASELHFGRAAARCFVSQPTLSVGVKRLEESLGVQIFERASRAAVRVTPEGRAIIEQAERVLAEMEQLEVLADAHRDPLAIPLRVGLIHTVGPYLLPRLIGRLHDLAPRMPIEITEGMTADLAERLEQGELDVVVLSLPFDVPGVEVEPIYSEPFMVAVPVDHPLVGQDALEPDQLAEHDLLLLGRGHCFRDQVLEVCPRCGDGRIFGRLQRTLEGGSLETMRMMVASGAGITVLPCASIEEGQGAGTQGLVRYLPFASDIPTREVALASRERFSRPQAVAVLARSIRETLPACCDPLPAGSAVSRE